MQGIRSGNIVESVAQIKQYATIAENFFLGEGTFKQGVLQRGPSGLSTALKSAGEFVSKLKFW